MISLILTSLIASNSAAAPTMPVIPPGTYTYKSTINGASTGTGDIVVKAMPAGFEIDEQGSGTFQGMSASAKTTTTLGTDLAPTTYIAAYNVAGQAIAASVHVKNGSASLASPMGTNTSYELDGAKHFVVLDGALIGGYVALPAQMQAWGNAPIQAIAPTFGQAVLMSIDATAKPVRPADVAATDTSLSFATPVALTLWFDPTTFVTDEVDVPSQGLVVTRVR